MDNQILGALGTGLSVTTFLVGFASIRLRAQRDRAVSHSDNVLRDLVRASSEGRALSDAEVEQSTYGFDDSTRMDPVAKGAVWFFWLVASLMIALCVVGVEKSGGSPTLVVSTWSIGSLVAGFFLILQLGICLSGTSDYFYIRSDLAKRLRESTLGVVERAIAARRSGDLTEARKLADDLVLRLPSWPWAYAYRGLVRIKAGSKDEAVRDLDHAIALRADYPLARLARAESRLSTGDAIGALEDLDELPTEWRAEAAVLKLTGAVLYKLGRRDEAIAAFDRVVRRDPNDTEARAGRGEALAASAADLEHRTNSISALEVLVMEHGEQVALSTLSTVGRESLSRREISTAIEDFTFALSQAPEDRRLLSLRGDAHYRNDNAVAGDADFEAALRFANPKQAAEVHWRRGIARTRANDALGALSSFDQSIQVYKTHQALFLRSLCQADLAQVDKALSDVEAAIAMAPGVADYLSHRAAYLAGVGQKSHSDESFRSVEREFPGDAHNYSLWIESMIDDDDLVGALVLSGRAVAACPDDPHLRLVAARTHSLNGQAAAALNHISRALDLGGDPTRCAYMSARALADDGRLDEAELRVFQAAEEPSEYQHIALSTRYSIRRRKGDFDGALQDVSRAIDLCPLIEGFWVRRACVVLSSRGPDPHVLTDIQTALSINPKSTAALGHLSEYHLALGDSAQAITAARQAIEVGGGVHAKSCLMKALFGAEQWDEAADLAAELVRLNGADAGALWLRGAAYSNGGRFAEAEAAFSVLCSSKPDDLSARAALAVAVSQQNRSDESVQLFRELRAEFGDRAISWMGESLNPDLLPKYPIVMRDWALSDVEDSNDHDVVGDASSLGDTGGR